MIPIPYLREVLAGLLALVLIGAGVQTVRLNICQANLRASKAEAVAYRQNLELARSTVVDLRATINDQNEKIRAAELAGAEAQAMQGMVDSMATQLDNAEALISRIQRENIDLRERTKDLTVCETYELCLRSIAGVLP